MSDNQPALPAWLAGFLGLAAGVALGLVGSMLGDSTVTELQAAQAAVESHVATIAERDATIAASKTQLVKAASSKKQALANLELEHEAQREKQYAKSDAAVEKIAKRAFAAEDALRAATSLKQERSEPESKNEPTLGISRQQILDALQRVYTIKVVSEDEDRFTASFGQDVVIMISGPREDVLNLEILGTFTTGNLTDLGRTLGIVCREVFDDDTWLEKWVPPAIEKVDVNYTIVGQHEDYTLKLAGFVLGDNAMVVFALER